MFLFPWNTIIFHSSDKFDTKLKSQDVFDAPYQPAEFDLKDSLKKEKKCSNYESWVQKVKLYIEENLSIKALFAKFPDIRISLLEAFRKKGSIINQYKIPQNFQEPLKEKFKK